MTEDSCNVQFIEIVPLTRDTDSTDSTSMTESDSGDLSVGVKQENLPAVKQEPDDVSDFSKYVCACCK